MATNIIPNNGETQQVRLLRSMYIRGEYYAADTVVAVSKRDARDMIFHERAVPFVEQPASVAPAQEAAPAEIAPIANEAPAQAEKPEAAAPAAADTAPATEPSAPSTAAPQASVKRSRKPKTETVQAPASE